MNVCECVAGPSQSRLSCLRVHDQFAQSGARLEPVGADLSESAAIPALLSLTNARSQPVICAIMRSGFSITVIEKQGAPRRVCGPLFSYNALSKCAAPERAGRCSP